MLVVLQLDRQVLASLLGCLEKVPVDKLQVLAVLLLEIVETVYVCDEARVSDVVEGDVNPSAAVMIGLDDEHVIVINEGSLLVKRRRRIKGFGVDGFVWYVGVGGAHDDGVRCVGEESIPRGNDESPIQTGDKDSVACIATLVKSMPS